MDRIVTIKIAAYFFCIVSSASLFAMELEVQKSKGSCVVKKALLCTEIMKKYEVPQDVAAIIKSDTCYLSRMDTIYKKFDPFFHFDRSDYRTKYRDRRTSLAEGYRHNNGFSGVCWEDTCMGSLDYELQSREWTYYAQKYAHENCRKFDVVTPQDLFFFTESHDDILVSLISRQGCFVHDQGNFRIELTLEEREKYLMLPDQLRHILSQYPRSYVDKK